MTNAIFIHLLVVILKDFDCLLDALESVPDMREWVLQRLVLALYCCYRYATCMHIHNSCVVTVWASLLQLL